MNESRKRTVNQNVKLFIDTFKERDNSYIFFIFLERNPKKNKTKMTMF